MRSRLSIATASVEFVAPIHTGGNVAAATSTLPSVGAKPSAVLASAYHTAARDAIKSKYSAKDLTVWGMTLKVMREEGGVKGLYRGLVTTAVGVAPYVGINFAAYEALRAVITPPGKTGVGRKLSCGALAGELE